MLKVHCTPALGLLSTRQCRVTLLPWAALHRAGYCRGATRYLRWREAGVMVGAQARLSRGREAMARPARREGEWQRGEGRVVTNTCQGRMAGIKQVKRQ